MYKKEISIFILKKITGLSHIFYHFMSVQTEGEGKEQKQRQWEAGNKRRVRRREGCPSVASGSFSCFWQGCRAEPVLVKAKETNPGDEEMRETLLHVPLWVCPVSQDVYLHRGEGQSSPFTRGLWKRCGKKFWVWTWSKKSALSPRSVSANFSVLGRVKHAWLQLDVDKDCKRGGGEKLQWIFPYKFNPL